MLSNINVETSYSDIPTAVVKKNLKNKIIEQEILELGYEKQNQTLVELGFTKIKRNLRCLKKFNGDLTSVIDKFNAKNSKKIENGNKAKKEKKFKKFLKQIENLPYEEQNQHVIDVGLIDIKQNLNYLQLNDGDKQMRQNSLKRL